MEAIKQWITCIIFSSLVSAVVSILSPKGSTKRAMQTVIAVFLLSAFLSPVIGKNSVDFEFDFPDFSSYQSLLSDSITEEMLLKAESQASIEVEKLLESLNISNFTVTSEADINEENSIYIKTVFITLSSDYSHREKQITSNIQSMLGAEAEYKWEKK